MAARSPNQTIKPPKYFPSCYFFMKFIFLIGIDKIIVKKRNELERKDWNALYKRKQTKLFGHDILHNHNGKHINIFPSSKN